MIKINLLPQPRPKAKRPAVPAGAAAQGILLLVGFLAGLAVAGALYVLNGQLLKSRQAELTREQEEKIRLEKIKAEVEHYENQLRIYEQRIAVITELQRNRVGGQELLDAVEKTVRRTETLWLTSMARKGATLTIEGTADSITVIANFITNLKRAGYFEKVEIKETRQDEKNPVVQTFLFTLSADFVLPGSKQPQAAEPAKTQGRS